MAFQAPCMHQHTWFCLHWSALGCAVEKCGQFSAGGLAHLSYLFFLEHLNLSKGAAGETYAMINAGVSDEMCLATGGWSTYPAWWRWSS